MGGPALFFDRDGVLNRVVARDGGWYSPRTLDEFRLASDLPSVAARLKGREFPVLVVSNQPDIARGRMTTETLAAMNAQVQAVLNPDEIYCCTHDDADNCTCRKPKPGAFLALAGTWDVDLPRSVLIGDTAKDMQAGRAAGLATVLIDTDYNRGVEADRHATTLLGAVETALDIIS